MWGRASPMELEQPCVPSSCLDTWKRPGSHGGRRLSKGPVCGAPPGLALGTSWPPFPAASAGLQGGARAGGGPQALAGVGGAGPGPAAAGGPARGGLWCRSPRSRGGIMSAEDADEPVPGTPTPAGVRQPFLGQSAQREVCWALPAPLPAVHLPAAQGLPVSPQEGSRAASAWRGTAWARGAGLSLRVSHATWAPQPPSRRRSWASSGTGGDGEAWPGRFCVRHLVCPRRQALWWALTHAHLHTVCTRRPQTRAHVHPPHVIHKPPCQTPLSVTYPATPCPDLVHWPPSKSLCRFSAGLCLPPQKGRPGSLPPSLPLRRCCLLALLQGLAQCHRSAATIGV